MCMDCVNTIWKWYGETVYIVQSGEILDYSLQWNVFSILNFFASFCPIYASQ